MQPRTHAAKRRAPPFILILLLLALSFSGCAASGCDPAVLRLGYFPNVTHAQPLYGVESGLYQEKLGDIKLETLTFNAGPAAFEALNAGSVDVIYVGPSPTLNAIERSGSSDVVRIIAGSAIGGASFILRKDVSLANDADLAGKVFATPQQGNTQDIALKHYMKGRGHTSSDKGGDVEVRYAANADILTMFQKGEIDGAWVPEPWATRLVLEGDGVIFLDEASLWPEGKFITTQVVTTRSCLQASAVGIGRLLDGHIAATKVLQHPDDKVNKTINDAIKAITTKQLGDATLRSALSHVRFDTDPLPSAMGTLSDWSMDLGFSHAKPDLDAAYDLKPLQEALARAGPR